MSNVVLLNAIVDEIFQVLEDVRDMLNKWDSCYHTPFIKKAMYLNTLRERLYELGYTEDFVEAIIKTAYEHVFRETERMAYAGKWYIVK
ncbi:MAG TPA: hypothetical protein VFQ36_10875 [Ktedonobacteraceae bacterium]|nr:hypothetical protein [Ktedonobacteraceae bacterium]